MSSARCPVEGRASRRIFYHFFYYTSKVCLYGMNRITASSLAPEFSGEKQAVEWVLNHIGTKEKITIFDCGANYGYYTHMLLPILGDREFELRLFEPSHSCVEKLSQDYGSCDNIHIHKLALSDHSGLAELYFPWIGSSGASLSEEVSRAHTTDRLKLKSEQVELATLDQFCQTQGIDHIDLLKLDVEGYEAIALSGAAQLLEQGKISYIQVEIGSASLGTKCLLYDIWNMLHESYYFYLILKNDMVFIKNYCPDLECFLGATNFLLAAK